MESISFALFVPREVLLDHSQDFLPRRDAGHMGAKEPRLVLTLGIVEGKLPHQKRPLLVAEPAAAQLIVPEQALLLFFQRWLGRDLFAANRSCGLLEQPR